MFARRLALLVLAAMLLQACDRSAFDEDDGVENGRLVLGDRVDGVRLGEDTLVVVARWGPPTRVVRSHGTLRYFYESGTHAGIEVYYDQTGDGRLSERTAFRLTEPYAGRTEEGVGLGDARADVIEALGAPGGSLPGDGGRRFDSYVGPGGNPFQLVYRGEMLEEIGMAGRAVELR